MANIKKIVFVSFLILGMSGCIPSGMVVGSTTSTTTTLTDTDNTNYVSTPATPQVLQNNNNINANLFLHYNDSPDMKYIQNFLYK